MGDVLKALSLVGLVGPGAAAPSQKAKSLGEQNKLKIQLRHSRTNRTIA